MIQFNAARQLEVPQKAFLMEAIDLALDQLDLGTSDLEKIESAYNGVGNYLAGCEHPLLEDAEIYPQGSIRLRTTVKPRTKEEFDVDLILFLPNAGNATRDEINDVVWKHLKASKVYGPLAEPLARGFRINYSGNYHLDITPAVEYTAEELRGQPLWVVDKRFQFKESNPEGFALCFDDACGLLPKIMRTQSFRETLSAEMIKDFPDQNDKKLLNRIIQVIKRHRDVWAAREDNRYGEYKPISVLLTTLATLAYLHIVRLGKTFSSELDVLLDVLELMPTFIQQANDEYRVENPSMHEENYAEKWNRKEKMEGPKLRQGFFEWHKAAIHDLEELARASNQGMNVMFASLSEALGERPVKAARESIVETVSASREKGNLGVVLGTGAIAAAAPKTVKAVTAKTNPIVPVKKNRFYGGE
ncbi:nucleotidyltransferase domain-containing protein [Alteromonas sp. 009811495]|uniref:nucleotidyltransferase domain-containing protein n=1 Tax=Alteromonas sp. 009811495 TaxID=3002962 RepID=UPI00237D96E0|nr:nucleotidyltransferase [Alteromonas sp. 009811495]WDT86993.1 nucleotidyltransferase [Alteromonas sp. 009811495]